MKKINNILVFVVLFLISGSLASQEIITKMSTNPSIEKASKNVQQKSKSTSSLFLPFFDDFSGNDVYPSQEFWTDNYAYINSDFAYHPVSYGVATLDALNEKGKVYPSLHPGMAGIADYLTSQPIRLDSIYIGTEGRRLRDLDSVYLSFFFQPNRWDKIFAANDGVPQDSLVVEFYSPVDDEWYYAWSTARFPFDSIKPEENNNRYFIEVIIPITDEERYFHDGFQFRFKNYVTLAEASYHPGWQVNCSQWNIDYVYLNYDRRVNTFYSDICFAGEAKSFLKNYYSMPYHQYSASGYLLGEMVDSVDFIFISNLAAATNNIGYGYQVYDNKGAAVQSGSYNGGSLTISPYHTSGYYNNASIFPKPKFFPPDYTGKVDSTEFLIKHYISTNLQGFKQNDTITFEQKFHNYYAYDNGSPEYSYTLATSGPGMLAVKFRLNADDSLRAVKIYFNDIAGSNEELYYNLCVWNQDTVPGALSPGVLRHSQEIVVKKDSVKMNDFITIMLDKPVYITPATFPMRLFFVGIEKSASEDMALGLDISRSSKQNTYYKVTGKWEQSYFDASVMIRPVLGKPFKLAGIENHMETEISVYPNPVTNGKINIISSEEINSVYIYNSFGAKVFEQRNIAADNTSIELGSIRNGMYLVVIMDEKGMRHTRKIILAQ